VDRAVEVAKATGAGLWILTASPDRRRAEKIVTAEAERHEGSGVEIHTEVSTSDATTAIIETCEAASFDLVVLGNKGMTGPGRFLQLGAVANKVSHHTTCNLLIVCTT